MRIIAKMDNGQWTMDNYFADTHASPRTVESTKKKYEQTQNRKHRIDFFPIGNGQN